MTTRIRDVPALAGHAASLSALGFDTLEQVLGAAQVAGPELGRALGVGIADLIGSTMAIAAPVTDEMADRLWSLPCAMGARLDSPAPREAIGAAVAMALPAAAPSVNHLPAMPPVRHQGDRGTCVAHAALAAYEHYLAVNGSGTDMSEQFLYWNCKQNDGIPTTTGTWLRVAFPLLHRDGVCPEDAWPYDSRILPGNEAHDPPPPGARRAALGYRAGNQPTMLPPNSVSDIRNALFGGRCVAFSVPVYNSWWASMEVRRTGDITNPLPGEAPSGGHAMCLVGYVDMPDRPEIGGGRFILRNSWGSLWGGQSAYGAGNGTISYSYVARHCFEAFAIA